MNLRIEPCHEDEIYFKSQIKLIQQNDGHCPCALVKTVDTKCLCKAFREMATEGTCECGLFRKVLS